ncbi:diaminopimelate epimerase [Salibacter sp.]|uniref:diaminopimelate epimerase n=1 Tax=Salibacter sp. TaxID=2010995 RepID=UPI0028705B1B|nr:diaminopimelate epimerase [Salibacter sp.]MDR9488420.1 diaminopimelate epimerase [Salibacter sp.]
MKVTFYKYHGTGNDFVLIDDRKNEFPADNAELIGKLCERRFGIGADGLMLLRNHPTLDFEMIYFNSDGRYSSMCGNGGRCIVAFAKFLGIIENQTTFMAVDGEHKAQFSGNWVELQMNAKSAVEERDGDYVLDTGSPHFIHFQNAEISNADLNKYVEEIRFGAEFKEEGININLVQPVGEVLNMRTYERGVEDETFSCGTGVTAVAISNAFRKKQDGKIDQPIKARGGDLSVSFEKNGNEISNIWLKGPAEQVFKGEVEI